MTASAAIVHIVGVLVVSIHCIHVPGENVDKKVLNSLGIKTIGWQSESTSSHSKVNVYHNYSKISVQNENVQAYHKYSQPPTSYRKTTNSLSELTQNGNNFKGPRVDSYLSQTNYEPEKDNQERYLQTSQNADQELQDLSKWNSSPKWTQISDSQQMKQSQQTNSYLSHSSFSGNYPNSVDKLKLTQSPNAYKGSLELGQIIEAEKQNQATQTYLDYDQEIAATSFYNEENVSPTLSKSKIVSTNRDSKILSGSKTYKNQNTENAMIPYTKCPEMATGQFVYQSSCYQFLNCWKGRGFIQNCAPGTLFNPMTLECDFASKVQCLTSLSTYHSEQYRDFNSDDIHKTGIECPPEYSGVIPHKSDCSKFINCAHGQKHVMDCPPGTLFSLKINNCDFPYNAECAGWSVEFGNNNLDYDTQSSSNYQSNSGLLSSTGTKASNGFVTSTGNQNGFTQTGNSASNLNRNDGYLTNSYTGFESGQQTGGRVNQNSNSYVQTGGGSYSGSQTSRGSFTGNQNSILDQTYQEIQGVGSGTYNGWKTSRGQGYTQTENSNPYLYTGHSQLSVQDASGNKQNSNYGGYIGLESSSHQSFSPNEDYYGQNTRNTLNQRQYGQNTQNAYNQGQYSQNTPNAFNQGQYSQNTQNAFNQKQYSQNTQNAFNQKQYSQNTQNAFNQKQYGQNAQNAFNQGYYVQNTQHPVITNQNIVNEDIQKTQYGLQGGADHTPRCPHGASGLFPHPTICAKFLNCANGQMFIQDCGPGTVFNPDIHVCDFPYNVECSNYMNIIDVRIQPKSKYPTQTDSTTIQKQYENKDTLEGASSNNIGQYISGHNTVKDDKTGIRNEQNVGNLAPFKCPNEEISFYPHPQFCSKYIACMNGKPYIYTCAPGTLFNSKIKICDDSRNVPCNDNTRKSNNIENVNQQTKINQFHDQNKQEQTSVDVHEQHENEHWAEETSQSNTDYVTINRHETNVGSKGDIKCPIHPVGFYPHPTVCAMYFTCSTGRPTVYKCATGTVFNPATKVCEVPQKVKCGVSNVYGDLGSVNQHDEQSGASANIYNQDNQQQGTKTTHTGNNKADGFDHTTYSHGGSLEAEVLESRSKFKEVCDAQDFYCSSNVCIPKSMECDGTKDCPNGSDEVNCGKYLERFVMKENSLLAIREKERYSNLTLTECAKSCIESKGFECKSFSYRSDAECFLSDSNVGLCGALIDAEPYKYYEVAALTLDCTNLHKCPNNKCINNTQICDGVNDCGDRSDEKGCPTQSFGYEIRLAGSKNKHEGRIELKAFGKWGYVCDDRFGMRDADVVCHELGFPLGALEVKGNSHYAKEVDENDVLYLMDDVVCLGNETSIKDCDFNGWGVSNCEPQEIVGVVCKTPVDKCPKDQFKCDTAQECVPLAFVCDNVFDCPDQSDEATQNCEAPSEIRLVNGKTEREGRIEIRHHGIWGTVCDDDFNDDAAKVVCNSLGFPGKAIVKKDAFFGEGEGPIWLDQVFCKGNETLLQDCTHWNWGEHNCEHSEDVGVVCSSSGLTPMPTEIVTENKGATDSPANLVEVPPAELFPTECGLRKSSSFYIDEVNFRVVQGSIAKKGLYPWQASLRIKNSAKPSHWCGAVVISRKFVLTAAHCLLGFSKGSYVVVAGDYNTDEDEGTEQEIYIEEFYIHEQFRNGQKMNNDIALIQLKGNGFTFTKDIQPICLPEADLAYTSQLNCTISGFGTVQTGKSGYSHDLRAGWVPIQHESVCKMPHVYGLAITDGMFCAGSLDEGVDACEGDSGGPLACLHDGVFTLYGITSWGQHCGHANKPGVYVKVAYYRNWIEKTMRKYIV